MKALKFEFSHAWRSFLSAPGFFALAILAMALGIAATTFMYSTGSNYLSALPLENPDNVIHIGFINRTNADRQRDAYLGEYFDFKEQLTGVEELGAFVTRNLNITGGEIPKRFNGAEISASAFNIIGSTPFLGRTFQETDMAKGAESVVIIGFNLWKNYYQSDKDIIGKQIRVNGTPTTIVGVMNGEFRYPRMQEIWIPLERFYPETTPRNRTTTVEIIGRLKVGISISSLQDEARSLVTVMSDTYPEIYKHYTSYVQAYADEFIGDSAQQAVYTLFITSLMVLLIACANVANLFLALGARRNREQAIQASLGASRDRLILRVLLESFIVCGLGGIVGLILGIYASHLIGALIVSSDPNIPFWIAQVMSQGFEFNAQNVQAIGFGFVAMLVATLVAGIVPALRMSRPDINVVLKANETAVTSGSQNDFSRWLVVVEIALACSLLIGASLLMKSSNQLDNLDMGISTDKLMTSKITLVGDKYERDIDKTLYYRRLKSEMLKISEVQNVGFTSSIPGSEAVRYYFAKYGDSYPRDEDYPIARRITLSAGMDKLYGLSLLQGRMFGQRDTLNSNPVAIISESMAKMHWPNGNAVGQQIRVGASESTRSWRTIVGVMPYINFQGALGRSKLREVIYEPIEQVPSSSFSVVTKTTVDPRRVRPMLSRAAGIVDPEQPIYLQRSLKEWTELNQFYFHLQSKIMTVFSLVAFVLATVGVYGVLSYSISQRTREFGIRHAMGADEMDTMKTIFKQSLLQLGQGIAVGLCLAVGIAKGIEAQLVNVSAFDLISFTCVPIIVAIITMLASWLPARKAAMVTPIIALRYE